MELDALDEKARKERDTGALAKARKLRAAHEQFVGLEVIAAGAVLLCIHV